MQLFELGRHVFTSQPEATIAFANPFGLRGEFSSTQCALGAKGSSDRNHLLMVTLAWCRGQSPPSLH